MSAVVFHVPGPVVPKARPRVLRDRRGRTRTITPERTEVYERKVRLCARAARVKPQEGRLAVYLLIRPENASRQDVDNLAKGVLDSLNGIAWEDDSQVDMLMVLRLHRDDVRGEGFEVGCTALICQVGELDHIRNLLSLEAAHPKAKT